MQQIEKLGNIRWHQQQEIELLFGLKVWNQGADNPTCDPIGVFVSHQARLGNEPFISGFNYADSLVVEQRANLGQSPSELAKGKLGTVCYRTSHLAQRVDDNGHIKSGKSRYRRLEICIFYRVPAVTPRLEGLIIGCNQSGVVKVRTWRSVGIMRIGVTKIL